MTLKAEVAYHTMLESLEIKPGLQWKKMVYLPHVTCTINQKHTQSSEWTTRQHSTAGTTVRQVSYQISPRAALSLLQVQEVK